MQIRKIVAIAVIALTAISHTPAMAGWEYAQWGMSVDELTAASNGLATKPSDPGASPDGSMTGRLATSFAIGDIKMSATFWYPKGRDELNHISMRPTLAEYCPQVREALTKLHGTAEENDEGQGKIYEWRDAKNKNKIALVDFSSIICVLHVAEL